MLPTQYYLGLSFMLFTLGALGVLIRRNAIIVFMSIELMLNSANLAFVAYARYYQALNGQIFVFFIMAGSAAAVAVGRTGTHCTIGKAPNSDLACVFLPDNVENKEKNKLISRKHCRLEIQPNRVIMEDLKSTNGTFVDNVRIRSPVTLRNGQMISLAAKLFLRYLDFRSLDESREVREALSRCTTALDCTTALAKLSLKKNRKSSPLEAFLLRRQNNYSDKLEYLFLIRSAILGSSLKYAAICVQENSVCDQHARLMGKVLEYVSPNYRLLAYLSVKE